MATRRYSQIPKATENCQPGIISERLLKDSFQLENESTVDCIR